MSRVTEDKNKWVSIQHAQKESVQLRRGNGIGERIEKLDRLKYLLEQHEEEWFEALYADLGNSAIEVYASELATTLNEIDHVKKNLRNWMTAEKKVTYSVMGEVERSILRRPYGSVLIISPWNYPLQLTVVPLIGAIAAGNRCFVKPSEKSQAVSHLLNKLITRYFDPEEITVVEGEAETAKALLELQWDYIFFTGSPSVGQKVYEAASKFITPVTLELGGKNPCIVDETNCTRGSVEKIIWGKFLNAGQTCIAPDTIYVQETVQEEFKRLAIETIRTFYGREPEESEHYSRLIDQKQLDKMRDHLTQGRIVYGGRSNEETGYFEPTLMEKIEKDSALATEEIFGPILPIVPYYSLRLLLEQLQQQEAPLVTYFFTKQTSRIEKVEQAMKTGAVLVNQVLLHVADPNIPFGGVGRSGLGSYHGRYSYETFTYEKVLYHQTADYANRLLFPPYSSGALNGLKSGRNWLT
ncbi:aldehyde dehydrogenase family protein [Lacticigenium naphthae]|uniref:aldehyde dehydrogenase family protein n=1 Tax=Lacticigenium naphthae TaxID=515351 RepID=UPI000405D543|nr:aldehyde dehydrogenase family protein [Lacticigenium naphthae]